MFQIIEFIWFLLLKVVKNKETKVKWKFYYKTLVIVLCVAPIQNRAKRSNGSPPANEKKKEKDEYWKNNQITSHLIENESRRDV